MSLKELDEKARAVRRLLRELHKVLDHTPEVDDNRYLQLVMSLNVFRRDLLCVMIEAGIVVKSSAREVGPGDFEAATRNRVRPAPDKQRTEVTAAAPREKSNPFAGNGRGW